MVPQPARPVAARRARRPDGLVHRPRHDPDRDLRVHLHATRSRAARAILYLIGTTLIVLGLAAAAAPSTVGKRDRDLARRSTARDAALIGFAQALALVPGVSRSGATITAGLFAGFDRESAARYSFLLSVPAVVLSGLFEARKIGGEGGADVVPTADRDAAGLRRRLRVDRLDAALAGLALDGGVRDLPRRARRAGHRAHRRGRHLVAFLGNGRPRARPPAAVRLPPAGREDPRGLLLRRVLQPDEVAAGGRRAPPAGADAGLPAQGLDPRRDRRGDRRAQAGRRPLRGRPSGSTASSSLEVRALHEGDEISPWETRDDDRGRLLGLRPPRDRLPRRDGPPHADHAQRARGRRRRRAASRSCTSPPATTTGSCRPATAGRRTSPARSASRPTRRPRGGAAAASAPSRTG